MATGNLQTKLAALRDGEIDFTTFVRDTRTEFRRMAAWLLRRWKCPAWYVQEDAEQELVLAAWDGIRTYDPTRGASLSKYVVFQVLYRAKRAIHKARGVSLNGYGDRHPDRKVSRFEIPASALARDGSEEVDRLIDAANAVDPIVEERLVESSAVFEQADRLILACESESELHAVYAIRDAGSVEGAAQLLYDDVDARVDFRLGNEESAAHFVSKHALAVARRATGRPDPKRSIDFSGFFEE